MNVGFSRFQNAFKLLGLEVGASIEEIKSSYRSLAKKIHPDKNRGKCEKSAHENFTKLRDSYVLLCNEVERRRFEKEYISFSSNKPRRKGGQHADFYCSLNANSSRTDRLLKEGGHDRTNLESLYRESIHLVNVFRDCSEPKIVKDYKRNSGQNLRRALIYARIDKAVDRFNDFEKLVLFKLAHITRPLNNRNHQNASST
ncbi:molecular chaperone [Cryptosporidium sp. chipmunk genotype I]|uniref:molecular chaperone n=1 Tax=Cryptosporidium sp. chipmunk genotype I TaxID=1280935 RepID=UPI00351A32BD|nr:molecular chaperone [Cryptosporidium sp. chipmunk genotype I]